MTALHEQFFISPSLLIHTLLNPIKIQNRNVTSRLHSGVLSLFVEANRALIYARALPSLEPICAPRVIAFTCKCNLVRRISPH